MWHVDTRVWRVGIHSEWVRLSDLPTWSELSNFNFSSTLNLMFLFNFQLLSWELEIKFSIQFSLHVGNNSWQNSAMVFIWDLKTDLWTLCNYSSNENKLKWLDQDTPDFSKIKEIRIELLMFKFKVEMYWLLKSAIRHVF